MIPYTQTERLLLLEELERGEKIVLPVSIEHAEFMIKVATFYIDQHHKEMLKSLTKDHSK
jgi:hypothetical protein